MSWVIKDSFGMYLADTRGNPFWTSEREEAKRFVHRDAAMVALVTIRDGEYVEDCRVIRLVPKRKAPACVCSDPRAILVTAGDLERKREQGRFDEREAIAAWFERTFTMGILGTDTARRIRNGEHRR